MFFLYLFFTFVYESLNFIFMELKRDVFGNARRVEQGHTLFEPGAIASIGRHIIAQCREIEVPVVARATTLQAGQTGVARRANCVMFVPAFNFKVQKRFAITLAALCLELARSRGTV